MSILEIKQELELLNQQLADLETNIPDPIERNESKQQLNKQIKKLENNLKKLEQIELDRQELRAIQSELELNNELSKNQSQAQKEKKVLVDTIVLNKNPISIDAEQDINLRQPENQNSQQTQVKDPVITFSSSTSNYATPNGLKDWQKTVISSSVIGIFIFLGLIFFKSNYSIQSTTSSPTENQSQFSLSETTTSPNSTSYPENFKQDNSSETEEVIESLPEVTNPSQESYSDNSTASESEIIDSNYNFPLDSCGDKNLGGANSWYPVYVDDTPENLNTVRSNYCRDAIRKYRKKEQINAIQVASFTNQLKAEEFAQLMQMNIGSGEVGEPTVYNFSGDSHTSPSHNYSTKTEATYHTNLIPIGNYSFYERGLRKMVSYQRTGNRMVGGVYDRQNPNVVTCFAATIYSNQVAVDWWDNLWQIGKSGNSFSYTYTVAAFTADNGSSQPYLDNPNAVTKCN